MTAATPLALIAITFAAAAIVPAVYRRWPTIAGYLAVATSTLCFAAFVAYAAIDPGAETSQRVSWIPSLGIAATFRIDGLSLLFALLITGIGALVLGYTPTYLDHERRTGRLLGLLLAFEAAMLGLVLADDTITLFVFWELTSVSSFFLIAFDSRSEAARTRARQALVVTSGGGLVMFVGLLLLARAATPDGSIAVSFSQLAEQHLAGHPHYAAIVILIAIGAFTKSAQFPFHFWLPGAMVAPSPVSAYLHSATMVKAGIYVLARLHPTLGGTSLWIGLLATIGAFTFVLGGVLATLQRDVKLTLAYATISALGALTLLLGIGTTYALGGALVLLVAHACYKAALFLTAGNLDHHRGTRDPFAPLGEPRDMPVTATTAAIAAASMAGIPPLLGFIAKDAVLAATLQGAAAAAATIAAVIAGAGLVTAAWLSGVSPYMRSWGRWTRDDVPRAMLIGPALLALASLAFGLLPALVAQPLIDGAIAAVAGRRLEYEVALWPGLGGAHGLAFLLGLVSIAIGIGAAVVVWRRRHVLAGSRERFAKLSASRIHEGLLDALGKLASATTRRLQHGHLPTYIATVIATVVVVTALPLVLADIDPSSTTTRGRDTYETPLLIVAACSAIAAAVFRDRLSAVAALAALGLAVTFIFALFSGPDLAITQLTVETMMVILLVLVFRRLPPAETRTRRRGKAMRLVVAVSSGALVSTLLVLTSSTRGFDRDASAAQTRLASEQEFTNVVNAILVNFRALDTLGEITVLAIAGIGVAALASAKRRRR